MEMSLIHAGLAAGAGLAALPVILHLFMRQTPKHVIFPALRLLRERQKQSKKRMRIKNWLLLLARGIYCRPSPSEQPSPLPWQQLVISLNALQNLPVAAGGRTALELQGFSHYLTASGAREAHLFANEDLPGWVARVPVNTKLVVHSARRLFRNRDVPPFFPEGIEPRARTPRPRLCRRPHYPLP